tara:strand:- start:3132 stop:3590 length:459 start_codon:yes stop_codon:yes gene_type:complete
VAITRARDHFDILCDGVRYGLVVERLLKTEARQFVAAIQPAIDSFEAANEPYKVETAEAKAEKRPADFSALAPLPNVTEQLFAVSLPVIAARAVEVTIRDGDDLETFDAAGRRDEFAEFVDAKIPDGPIIYWGRLMREAKAGNSVARADSLV